MSQSTSIQKWGSWTDEEADKDRKELESKGNFFKIQKPRTQLRFLPPRKGLSNPMVKTYQHFVDLVPNDKRTTVIFNCPRRMSGGKRACPLCAQAERKKATGRQADKERAYELFPKLRVYSAIIDRADEDKGVQIYPFGKTIMDKLLNLREDGDFTHPINGYDIQIIKKGSTKNDTEYDAKMARNASPLTDDAELLDEWLDALPDLVQYAFVPSDDEIREKMDQAFAAGDEEEEEEAPANTNRRAGAGKSRAIDTTGEEVEDEDLWSR